MSPSPTSSACPVSAKKAIPEVSVCPVSAKGGFLPTLNWQRRPFCNPLPMLPSSSDLSSPQPVDQLAPPRLLTPSAPPETAVPKAPSSFLWLGLGQPLLVIRHGLPGLHLRLIPPPLWLREAPTSLQRHFGLHSRLASPFSLWPHSCFNRVFGESVSVMAGDSVTLNTDVTGIPEDEEIVWKYGAENSLIAKISIDTRVFSTYDDVPDGRFRDRLKLDDQTGSLTITHTTTEHAGVYEVKMSGAKLRSKTFNVSVYARLPVPVIISNSSQCSSNCSLVCSSVCNVSDATLSWYAGMSVLSSISVCDLSISLSLPLEVEYQDKNTYSCVLNNPISNQTTHLDINTLCHTCAAPDTHSSSHSPVSLIVLISAGSLMIVAVVVIFCICRRLRKIDGEVETRDEEIIYADPTFCKRKAYKLNIKEENDVVYAGITVRR
ncbi:uncharacterized protein LOC130086987 [Rhinichthys klamathensis goyatoka]|uniref:uncharacterized protein LOC130086987 n=1 Tax=Rhinichthys klamathensis goyatoka TaxID=3034132 RepID=UPI0024B48917|nr:uncharacterized protein LOC130086987 [Rhinichthys klamathensis goyatoka]